MSEEALERHIPYEGCFNFRDLGGYHTHDGRAVRWRRLFRSGELQYMTQADKTHAREELGIVTVIDLRNPKAAARDGTGPIVGGPTRYYNIPLLDDDWMESRVPEPSPTIGYIEALKHPDFGESVALVFRTIANAEAYPAVFHCTGGKDRTGMLAAIILGVLGVADQDIVQDYVVSVRYFGPLLDRLRSDPARSHILQRLPPSWWEIRPEIMEVMLDFVRREYGSMRGYVKAHGVNQETLRLLEERLLTAVVPS